MIQMKKVLAMGLAQVMAFSILTAVPTTEVKANDAKTYNGHYSKLYTLPRR